ncbi:MAG: YwaF family protein [Erysipelotrichaceae bacterium]|nr:YwaF family protein [Erysipelotrichaceae bacterium]
MDITFKETPVLFGTFHLTCLLLISIVSVLFYFRLRYKDEERLLTILHVFGLVMIIAEVWKQVFTYIYVYDRVYNMWFFPWQLCSMAMYCSFFVKYLRKELQNAVLVFLSTFSFLAAVVALMGPLDMLRPQILLTCHGFLYHGLMILESVTAYIILTKRKDFCFRPALILFLLMAVIAEIINITAHGIFHDIHREPDMFYITPYYATTQPVFSQVAKTCGIFTGVVFYLSTIVFFSWLIYKLIFRKQRDV